MKTRTNNYSQKLKKLTMIALFCALSYVVSAILPIKVMFLTLDFKDAISAMCGLFFGPVAGLFCAIIVPFIEFLTTSGTGPYGLIMNLISSISFVGISALIYKYKKTLWGAIASLVSAVAVTVAIMMVANLYITPLYMKVTRDEVVALIPSLLLPFNLTKSVLNAGIAMLLYKPISKVLKRMGATNGGSVPTPSQEVKMANKKRSIIVTIVSAVIIIVALVVVFSVLGGKIA